MSIKCSMFSLAILCYALSGASLAGSLAVEGTIHSREGGYVFPDGTVQQSAANPSQPVVGPAIGSLVLGTLPAMPVHSVDIGVENLLNKPLVTTFEVLVNAGEISPQLFIALLNHTQFTGSIIDLGGISFTLSGKTWVDYHEQVSQADASRPQFATLRLRTEKLQASAGGQTAGWDFIVNLPDGATCDDADRTYVVTRGLNSAGLSGVVVPAESYNLNLEYPIDPGAPVTPPVDFSPLELQLTDEHTEAVCALQYVFKRTDTPAGVTALTLGDNGPGDPRYFWYELHEPFVSNAVHPTESTPVSWSVSSDGQGGLDYEVVISYNQICHGFYSDGTGVVDECWNLETNTPP